MAALLRTEEWVLTDANEMKSTAIVEVREGEIVRVSSEVMDELAILKANALYVPLAYSETFIWEVPYVDVARALTDARYERSDAAA